MSEYYFNTRTGQVETDVDKSQSKDLLGPYPTREAAARALDAAHERTEKWDAEDEAWEHRGED